MESGNGRITPWSGKIWLFWKYWSFRDFSHVGIRTRPPPTSSVHVNFFLNICSLFIMPYFYHLHYIFVHTSTKAIFETNSRASIKLDRWSQKIQLREWRSETEKEGETKSVYWVGSNHRQLGVIFWVIKRES